MVRGGTFSANLYVLESVLESMLAMMWEPGLALESAPGSVKVRRPESVATFVPGSVPTEAPRWEPGSVPAWASGALESVKVSPPLPGMVASKYFTALGTSSPLRSSASQARPSINAGRQL